MKPPKIVESTRTFQNKSAEELPEYNQGIKAKPSKFGPKANPVKKQEFEESVEDYNERLEEIKKKAFELSTQFMSFVKDKTLPENRGPIQISLETDTTRELVDVASILNSDGNLPEGIGSSGCILLLLRVALAQRDIINELRYKVSQLEKHIAAEEKYGKKKKEPTPP